MPNQGKPGVNNAVRVTWKNNLFAVDKDDPVMAGSGNGVAFQWSVTNSAGKGAIDVLLGTSADPNTLPAGGTNGLANNIQAGATQTLILTVPNAVSGVYDYIFRVRLHNGTYQNLGADDPWLVLY